MRPGNNYALTLWLAGKPCFCCGCWWLSGADTQRTKRVLRLVRAVVKDWQLTAEESRRADASSNPPT
jgi:hypothetical protein